MRVLWLLAAAPFAAHWGLTGDFTGHIKTMQDAQSMKATFTVTRVGGSVEEQTLTLSRPSYLKWESPTKLVLSDGKTLWSYDKGEKVFSKSEATEANLAKAMGEDVVWVWSAFFDKEFAGSIASTQKGASRKVRNMAITDWIVTRKDKKVFTVPISDESGAAVGSRFTAEAGETLVLAKEITLGEDPLSGELFAWTPPADAKDSAAVAASASSFNDVKQIFLANCASCHGSRGPKGGIDLSSYEAIMASRSVRPGNANSSRLFRVIKSGKMPPAGPLPAELQQKIEKWINDGAKE